MERSGMTIYTTPRLKLTPAEERAADVMEWVHERISFVVCFPKEARNRKEAVRRVVRRHRGLVGNDLGPNSCLAAIALLEEVAFCPEWSVLRADDPIRLDMHDEEGER